MTRDDLLAAVQAHDYFLDWALIFHGFRSYMRDYEVIMWSPESSGESGTYSVLLKHCVEVNVRSAIRPDVWRISLDDRLTSFDTFSELDQAGSYDGGFVWGVGWANLYPGWSVSEASERAEEWTQHVGIQFHEARIASNVYDLTAIFAELMITKLSDGNDDPQVNGVPAWLRRFAG
jgi:hypothetical protein